MQANIDDTERDEIFQRLKTIPENNVCFDCNKKNPKWSSVYLGLYLCLDCAGKHREYGPQISFARSVNLDTWNRRYITFMELGGNAKALEYFRKQGLKAPYDYKNPLIQKYKQELTKKVDALLAEGTSKDGVNKPIVTNKAEEERPQQKETAGHSLAVKSFSDKPRHQEKEPEDPFANNIVLNKGEIKTKGFTVEFSKNKSGFAGNKGRIAAKKIDNVDLDALSLNEDATTFSKNKSDMAESAFGLNSQANTKEVFTKTNTVVVSKESDDDKFKKYQNAKAISSDAFRNDAKDPDAGNVKKFSNATAISSDMYFGNKEDEPENEIDYYQTAEDVKDFLSNVGGKLKTKAEGFVSKLKQEWS